MNRVLVLAVLLLVISIHACAGTKVKNRVFIEGKLVTSNTHVIVIPEKATPQEKHAAKELKLYLEMATAESLDIRTDTQIGKRFPIIVGKSQLINKLGVSVEYGKLGEDGIVIRTVGSALILTGNARGVLYAVYTFLDEYIGFKWLSPECMVVPNGKNIHLKSLDVTYVPPFATRALDYYSAFDQDWAVRNKINGYGYAKRSSIDEEHGGEVAYPSPFFFWHTIRQWIPFDKYRDTHPEYFSELDGRRVATNDLETDYCMTNPEVVKLVIDGVRKTLRDHPDSTMIGISQNDHSDRYCRCIKCAALVKEHGQPSALIVNLVNQVAAVIEDEFPRVKLTMLAYHWSQTPPVNMPLHRNIVVEICPLGMDQSHPIEKTNTEYTRKLKSDLTGWAKLCAGQQLKMCNYSINYARLYQPHPNLYSFKPNMNFFIKNGAGHFYDCGSYTSKASEFADLRAYLIAKLAWNPSENTDRIIDEFVNGYYGKAAKPIKAYIKLIHKYASSVGDLQMDCYASLENGQISQNVLSEANKLFDTAEKLVKDDPITRDRVEIARLPIMFSQIDLAVNSYENVGNQLVCDLNTQKESLDRFLSILNKHQMTRMTDVSYLTTSEWSDPLKAQLEAKPLNTYTIDNNNIRLVLVPEAGGRIWKMIHKKSGRDLLGIWGVNRESAVFGRGYEEYSNGADRTIGPNASYNVTESSGRSITMVAELSNGLSNTRTVSLDQKSATVTVSSSYTNVSTNPVKLLIGIHPTIQTAGNGNTIVESLENGRVVEKYRMTGRPGSYAHWVKPTGMWRLVNKSAGMAFTQTYDKSLVEQSVVWYRNLHPDICTFELLFKEKAIDPGESYVFTHSYAIEELSK